MPSNPRRTTEATDRPDNATRSLSAGERVVLGTLDLEDGDDVPNPDDIEPLLSALLQIEHLNLLVGAGLPLALVQYSGCSSTLDMSERLDIKDKELAESIEDAASESARRIGRGQANLEDRLRIAIAAAEGLAVVDPEGASELRQAIQDTLEYIRSSIQETERELRDAQDLQLSDGHTIRSILTSFLTSFAGRTPTRDRLHIFTTNYDRVLEWGAELAGIRVIDRFVGSLRPIFRSSQLQLDYFYSPSGSIQDPRYLDGVIRLTKLHGSIDWRFISSKGQIVRRPSPFGARSQHQASSPIVYPNAAKDWETTYYPFADLF